MAQNKTLELSIKIAGKMDKSLMAALNGSQSQISSFARSISSIGTAGLAAMGTLATATVATIASCTKEAAKFENYMADVVKYVDGLADATGKISDKVADNGKTYAQNYEAMKDAIKDLSTQIPYTQEDLTRLAAAAGQSGKAMEDLIKVDASGNVTGFLRDIAMTGAAMDISADQAGNWAAKWEQSLKMTHEEVMVLFDQINYLGANSATTAAEIAEAVNSAASLGQVGGVSAATTAALADAMLATGVSTDRVGTSIKRMIVNLSKGASATKAQKEQFEELGMSAEWVAKAMQEDSVGTLDTIFKAINDLPQERQVAALSTLFGQWAIEGGAKIVNNLDVYRKALEMVSDPSLYTGSMEREFNIKSQTPEAIETMLKSTKTALKIEIGDAFLPAKKQFNLSMIDFLNSIRKNMPELTTLELPFYFKHADNQFSALNSERTRILLNRMIGRVYPMQVQMATACGYEDFAADASVDLTDFRKQYPLAVKRSFFVEELQQDLGAKEIEAENPMALLLSGQAEIATVKLQQVVSAMERTEEEKKELVVLDSAQKIQTVYLLSGQDVMDSLTPRQRAAVKQAAVMACGYCRVLTDQKHQKEQEQLRRMGVEILPINLEKYYAMLGDIYQYENDRMLYQLDAELDRVMRSDSVKETF